MDKIYGFLLTACNSPQFISGKTTAEKDQDSEDTKTGIIISNLGKLIKMMSYLCKYSSEHCKIAVSEMNILQIIESLLQREYNKNKDSTSVLTETMSLLGALIPDSRSYKNDTSDFAKNEKAKSLMFEESDESENPFCVSMIQNIMPMMLKLYVSSFNQTVKFSILQLTEEIVLMMSENTLKRYLQPHLMSRFIITTMKSENYTWIEMCFRILITKKLGFCTLSLHREGIQEYLRIYSDKLKFRELTGIQIPDDEPKTEAQMEEDKINEMIKEVVNSGFKKSDNTAMEPLTKASKPSSDAMHSKMIKEMMEDIHSDEILRLETEPDYEQDTVIQQVENEDKQLIIEEKPVISTLPKTEEAKLETSSQVKLEDEKNSTEKLQVENINSEDITGVENKLEEQKLVDQTSEIVTESPIQSINASPIEEVKQSIIVDTSNSQPATLSTLEIVQNTELIIASQENMLDPEELIKTEAAINEIPDDLLEDKDYLDDLNLAIKQSMEEMEALKNLEQKDAPLSSTDALSNPISKEDEESKIDTLAQKKILSQRKVKKMFLKKAIQNLDETLSGLENIPDLEAEEVERVKEIILKKKQLKQSNDMYNYATRKYSRDFIGMHTAPMYKNIVTMAHQLLEDYERFFTDENCDEVRIMQKLCKLSDTMMAESKNSSTFDKEATTQIFKELVEFFKNDNSSITQYEMYKSKLVDALHSFLSLPLKKEESKTSKDSEEGSKGLQKKTDDDSHETTIDEYFTIMCRYMCLVEVFCEDDNPKILKSLFSVLEGSVKTSLGNHFSQELNIYNDGYNLAYDLKKYHKRNRLRLVYEPNIEDKIIADEALEKGYSSKAQLKDYFAKQKKLKKYGRPNNEDFEDSEFLKHFPTPAFDKTVSKQEVNENPLTEEIKDDKASDHSIVFLKRDALYKKLKSIDVTVENSSTLQVIKDFLRNRITNTLKINEFTQQSYIGEKARQKLAEMIEGNSSLNTQEEFNKMLLETIENEPNLDSNERALILEDLRRLSYSYGGGLHSFAQPPSQIYTGQTQFETLPSLNPTESSKQPEASEEEEKVLTSKSTDISSEMIKQRTISEADLDCRPIKYDEGSLGEELSEGEGEEGPMDGKPKPKWNILGSIKNFFFKDTNLTQPATQQKTEDIGKVPAYVQSSDGSQMSSSIPASPNPLAQPVPDASFITPPKKSQLIDPPSSSESPSQYIDDPIELKNLEEAEDVVFEFYYNRIKTSELKTIYELINYQPTHRTIVDPQVIYFKIKERNDKEEGDDKEDVKSDVKNLDKAKAETYEKSKHEELVEVIKSSTSDLFPSVAKFMHKFLSPYSFPLIKADTSTYYSSPYSYNQSSYQQTIKIGESIDDQRTSCNKILKIIEGIIYTIYNWNDFRMQTLVDSHTKDFSIENRDNINIKPELLFKNLLDEYIHKLLLEPLNLVLETKKNK